MAEKEQFLSQDIQLLPEEETHRRKALVSKLHNWSLVTGVVLLAIEIGAFSLFLYRDQQQEKLALAAQELKTVLGQVDQYTIVEENFRSLENNLKTLRAIRQQDAGLEYLLEAVEQAVPANLTLKTLTFGDEVVRLGGQTQDYVSVFYFIRSLKEQERIEDVSLESISRESESSPAEFRLAVVLSS